MGHLINPIGFRLGFSRGWLDMVYAEKDVYTYILHKMFLFKSIIKYIFDSWRFFKIGLIFSHLSFFFKTYVLFVKLYFYDSAFLEME